MKKTEFRQQTQDRRLKTQEIIQSILLSCQAN